MVIHFIVSSGIKDPLRPNPLAVPHHPPTWSAPRVTTTGQMQSLSLPTQPSCNLPALPLPP